MGGSLSRQADPEAEELKLLESRLSRLGDLPALRTLFSNLSPSSGPIAPSILEEHFKLENEGIACPPDSQLGVLSQKVAAGIISTIFMPDEKGISWKALVKGVETCHQPSISIRLQILLLFFYQLKKESGLPLSFSFENEDQSHPLQFTGHMNLSELQDFIWLCWLMEYVASHDKSSCPNLPNLNPLLESARVACAKENDVLPMKNLHKWMLLTIPRLPFPLLDYVLSCIQRSVATIQNKVLPNAEKEEHEADSLNAPHLLDSSVAWAIGLSLPDTLGAKFTSYSVTAQMDTTSLLYRSSMHGKGMNRFWVHVEGYKGTVLMLIHGVTSPNLEDKKSDTHVEEKWLLGALISEGFVNKNGFYGDRNCCLYALDPLMQYFRPSGISTNFVYSHSHVATSTSYLQQQKGPEGIAFGGDIGKERVFLDQDFTHVTVRHHAVDKTYEPGQLLPNQGYHTIKGKVMDVEVWGLGGASIIEKQAQFQERKNLFVEQKRKVDLQAFGNWSDSPEKLMMDMVSDPNRVQRQDR